MSIMTWSEQARRIRLLSVRYLTPVIGSVRAAKPLRIARWCAAVTFIGFVTGVMVVILPPLAAIGVVSVAAAVLLWALPELRLVPDGPLRKMFFAMVFVQLCVPNYYAIQIAFLPWLSVRRLFAFAVIILFCIVVAGSKSARGKLAETMRINRLLTTLAVGFLVMIFLSIFSSVFWPQSIKEFSDSLLAWYIPLFTSMLIVRSEEDVILLLKIIMVAGIIDALAGLLEFVLQRRYYFDVFPRSMLATMMAENPGLAAMFYTTSFRNGFYRASSIFSIPLSFGEFEAMIAPIGAYFVFHGVNAWQRFLGAVTVVLVMLAIFSSGARGAYMAFLVSMPVMFFLWTARYSKLNPRSLVGAIMYFIFTTGSAATLGLILFSGRIRNIVLGTGDAQTVASTEARVIQWNLAEPHILANPITGHGIGMSGDVVGYYYPGAELPSVDSYVITLLVETGVPGLLFFFGMIAFGIWVGVRLYLSDTDKRAAVGGPLACSLIAFCVYRFALSQRESHTLFFLIIGLVFAVAKLAYDRRVAMGRASSQNAPAPQWSETQPAEPAPLRP
jgi:O-antigen ligase